MFKEAHATFTFDFVVEHDAEADQWRATERDNHVTWGYGSSAYEAIANLCEELDALEDDSQ